MSIIDPTLPVASLVTVTARPPLPDPVPADAIQLAGIGLLVATPDGADWRFDLRVKVTSLDLGEAPLLEWATAALPRTGHVVGWQLAETIVAPLLTAAADAEPSLAQAFLQRLSRLVTCGSDDLAVAHGGAGAVSFGAHIAMLGIPGADLPATEIDTAWARGRMAEVRAMIEIQAIALLDRWAVAQGDAQAGLRVAMGRWLARHRAQGGRP